MKKCDVRPTPKISVCFWISQGAWPNLNSRGGQPLPAKLTLVRLSIAFVATSGTKSYLFLQIHNCSRRYSWKCSWAKEART